MIVWDNNNGIHDDDDDYDDDGDESISDKRKLYATNHKSSSSDHRVCDQCSPLLCSRVILKAATLTFGCNSDDYQNNLHSSAVSSEAAVDP